MTATGRPRPWSGTTGALLRDVGRRAAVPLAVGACVALTCVPDPRRPVLTAAGAAVAAALVAAATRSRIAGTAAVLLSTVTVVLAAALDPSPLRPVQLVGAGVLLLLALTALERCEAAAGRPLAETDRTTTVRRAPLTSRVGPPAAAVGAAALVAATAARDVVPSVGLVLGGLVAAVAALVLTTRAHREERGDG